MTGTGTLMAGLARCLCRSVAVLGEKMVNLCKSVGYAYEGSNPSPATIRVARPPTSGDAGWGPLSCGTAAIPGGSGTAAGPVVARMMEVGALRVDGRW